MTKTTIDKEFTKRIPLFTRVIKGRKVKSLRLTIETDSVLADTYLHIVKNADSLESPNDLERMGNKFITSNLGWHNSDMNKENRLLQENNFISLESEYNNKEANNIEDNEDGLNYKIDIEKRYNEMKGILELYYNQEPNQLLKVIFECYFEKNITSGAALARHLGVSVSYVLLLLRTMKANIQVFLKNQY